MLKLLPIHPDASASWGMAIMVAVTTPSNPSPATMARIANVVVCISVERAMGIMYLWRSSNFVVVNSDYWLCNCEMQD
jgi:hypothetical protein